MSDFGNEQSMFGKYIEDKLIEKLNKKFPKAYNCNVNGVTNKKWDLIVPEIKKTIEVKGDYISVRTGNLLVEVSGWKGDSGLRTTKADWWVFVTGFRLIWITPLELYRFIEKYPEYSIKDDNLKGKGDNYNKFVYKIKEEELIKYIYINLEKNEGYIEIIKSKDDPLYYMNCLKFNNELKLSKALENAEILTKKLEIQ